jgi:hypothetical protein
MVYAPARPELSQTGPNPAVRQPNLAKKKAWIALDRLVGNEPFQGVALTPRPDKGFSLGQMGFDSRDSCVISAAASRMPRREAISNSDFHSEGTIPLFWILEKELSLELHPIALGKPEALLCNRPNSKTATLEGSSGAAGELGGYR